jgi:hypothetical protein
MLSQGWYPMMAKNWGFIFSNATIIAFAGIVGLITPGCAGFASSSVQQDKNNPDINTANETVAVKQEEKTSAIPPQNESKTISVNQEEKTSIISTQSEDIQANTKNAANAPDKFGLQEEMPYQEARKILMQKGWQPNLLGEPPNLRSTVVKNLYDFGYKEVKDCSGTGMGLCRFEFTNQAGELLVVSARPNGSNSIERLVWRWFIEENTNNNQSENQEKLPFVGTRLFNFDGGNGTGRSITIAADGTTVIKINGKFSSSVIYSGKFANPIITQNEGSLLIKGHKIYRLSADGQIIKGCKGEGTLCESSLDEPSSPPIAEGIYVIGGTDQGLEVKGNLYRYVDELGSKEWRPISELIYIKERVIFDGKNYWCIPPGEGTGVCTKNGWTRPT